MFCRVYTGVQLVFYVTYVTTAPIVLPARSQGPPRIGISLSARIPTRLTETLFTDTVTSADRLQMMLRMLVVALAERVTPICGTAVATAASLTDCLER